ncbi:MAG: hypothetical protein ACLFP2_05340 [Candidatus Woesearchaeota archaeon]
MVTDIWPLSTKERAQYGRYTQLQDTFDLQFAQQFLFESYRTITNRGGRYRFLEVRGLQPGAVGYTQLEDTMAGHRSALILFMKDRLDSSHKKYIRFKNNYKVTRENLINKGLVEKSFAQEFNQLHALVAHKRFSKTLREILRTDFAALIQPDARMPDKYAITHYRVEIDHNLEEAVEELATEKKVIKNDLYESGEQVEEHLEAKFFEYYGFSHTSGGRRRAAVKAAHYLSRQEIPFTVYVASTEDRTLTRITEDNIIKYTLLKLNKKTQADLERHHPGSAKKIMHSDNLALFRVVYSRPEINGTEDLNKNWLHKDHEHLIPKRGYPSQRPIPYEIIYPKSDPFIRRNK